MPAPHTRRGASPSSFSQSGAWTSSTPLPSFSLLSSGPQEPSTTRLVALRNRRRVCQSAFELPSARPTLQSLSHLLVILPPWAAVCQGVISSDRRKGDSHEWHSEIHKSIVQLGIDKCRPLWDKDW